MKRIAEAFTEDGFKRLKQVKQDRSWHDAILEEFGVDEEDETDD